MTERVITIEPMRDPGLLEALAPLIVPGIYIGLFVLVSAACLWAIEQTRLDK